MPADTPASERDLEIPSFDGLALSGRIWHVDRPRGVVVVAHGLGEHGGAYGHVARALGRSSQVDVLAVDFRGHGRSPGRRGVVQRYEDLCGDLRAAIAFAAGRWPGLARFVLGHSNGGQVVLRSALDGGLDVAGAVLSNPALRIAAAVPRWKLGVGRVLRRVASAVTLRTSVDLDTLTRDPAMIEERRADPLRHSRINGPLFFGLIAGGADVARRAREFRLPVLLVLGGADPLIDAAFTSGVFDRLGSADKTRLTYPRMLHEPLNDLDREAPLAAIGRWLSDRLPPA